MGALYDDAVDCWAMGCIFFELLQSPYGKMPRRLFHACPTGGAGQTISEMCLMLGPPPTRAIRQWIGVVADDWLEFFDKIKPCSGLLRTQCLVTAQPPMSLESVDLLMRLLAFHPASRATAAEALRHKFIVGDEEPTAEDRSCGYSPTISKELERFETEVEAAVRSEDWQAQAIEVLEREIALVGTVNELQPSHSSSAELEAPVVMQRLRIDSGNSQQEEEVTDSEGSHQLVPPVPHEASDGNS